jgi:hypothetical protein
MFQLNLKKILVLSGLIILGTGWFFFSEAQTVSLENPLSGHDSLSAFLESIMGVLRSIIAYVAILFIAIAGILYLLAGSSGSSSMMTAAKLCLVGAILGLTLALAAPSFLQQLKLILLENNQMPTNISEAKPVRQIVVDTLTFLLSILGMLAIIGLVVSGIMYLIAGVNPAQATKAKNAMMASIAGVAIAGAGLIIVQQVISFFYPIAP